jgi:hypothetical protein
MFTEAALMFLGGALSSRLTAIKGQPSWVY